MSHIRALKAADRLFRDFIADRRLRLTMERTIILEEAVRRTAHFTVKDIIDSEVVAASGMSSTTVYSTLSLLVEAGILKRLSVPGRLPLYERSASIGGNQRSRRSHHHIICSCCGRIAETREPEISQDFINKILARVPGFEPKEASVTVYGFCRRCSRKHKAAKPSIPVK